MNALVCTKHDKGIIKEVWEPSCQTASLVETFRPFRIIKGSEETAFEKLKEDIKSNYCLPKGLRITSEEDYTYYSNSLTVYRYPILIRTYKPSCDQPKERCHKKLREWAKDLCRKTNGPIILAKGNESIGYKVSSKRIAVDGDFVIIYQEKHVVMTYDPTRVKKIRNHPGMLEDPIHRTGHFRIRELIEFMNIFEWDIRNIPAFKLTVHWIAFKNLFAPKEINAAKQILSLAKAVVHVCRCYSYREEPEFYEFLEKAKVVLKAIRERKIQVKSSALRKFYAFLRHEIRIAVRRGKMV